MTSGKGEKGTLAAWPAHTGARQTLPPNRLRRILSWVDLALALMSSPRDLSVAPRPATRPLGISFPGGNSAVVVTAGVSFHDNYAKWANTNEDPKPQSAY